MSVFLLSPSFFVQALPETNGFLTGETISENKVPVAAIRFWDMAGGWAGGRVGGRAHGQVRAHVTAEGAEWLATGARCGIQYLLRFLALSGTNLSALSGRTPARMALPRCPPCPPRSRHQLPGPAADADLPRPHHHRHSAARHHRGAKPVCVGWVLCCAVLCSAVLFCLPHNLPASCCPHCPASCCPLSARLLPPPLCSVPGVQRMPCHGMQPAGVWPSAPPAGSCCLTTTVEMDALPGVRFLRLLLAYSQATRMASCSCGTCAAPPPQAPLARPTPPAGRSERAGAATPPMPPLCLALLSLHGLTLGTLCWLLVAKLPSNKPGAPFPARQHLNAAPRARSRLPAALSRAGPTA